jgi:presenilin-like A22 family membrane protease
MAGALAFAIAESKVELESIMAFPETVAGATLNMLTYVVTMALVATIMYVLIKYGFEKIFRYLLKLAVVLVEFSLLSWYSNAFLGMIELPAGHAQLVSIIIPITLTTLLAYTINRGRGVPQVFAVTILGAMIGTFLGVSIQTLTTVILLLGLSIYDMLAVYKGPIGKIAEKVELESLTGATFTYRDLTVGLGDIVFYSMLVSHALFNFGSIAYLTTTIGVVAGTFLGFKMLEKREMFPGLPLSLVSGVTCMITTALGLGVLTL